MATPARPIAASDADALRSLLEGSVVVPGDQGWDEARRAWNLVADQRPAAVAFPADPGDVRALVRFAAGAGLRVAPQGTGHGAAPLGDLADAILMRTTAMRTAAIDPVARRARVEAGAIWDDVVPDASGRGLAARHGSSPDVGVAGYTLGGGTGWIARKHGLACNAVTAVELVTADGELVRADEDHEADLFWALRGGGGSFGAVTAMEFGLVPVERVYAGWLIWPWEESERVLGRWSEWTQTVPDELTSIGRILQLPPLPMIPEPLRGRDLVVVEAAYLGDEADGAALLRPLRELGPEMDTFAVMPAAGLARLHGDPEEPSPGIGRGAMLDAFTPGAVRALVAAAGPGSGSPLVSVEVRHLGGALARRAPGAGALSHLPAAFGVFGIGIVMPPERGPVIARHAEAVADALRPFGSGRAHLNFAETPIDVATAFPEDVYGRLRAVRARVDPSGVFRANHPIPGAE